MESLRASLFNTICRILTTGKSQEVGLPGERHEHPSNCNAGQRAVETPEPRVDVFKWGCKTESCHTETKSGQSLGQGARCSAMSCGAGGGGGDTSPESLLLRDLQKALGCRACLGHAWCGEDACIRSKVLCSPAMTPSSDPIAACRHMSGEESRMAHRKMPPVHGLSQPYIWPTPTGRDFNSCHRKYTIVATQTKGKKPAAALCNVNHRWTRMEFRNLRISTFYPSKSISVFC